MIKLIVIILALLGLIFVVLAIAGLTIVALAHRSMRRDLERRHAELSANLSDDEGGAQ